jgi:MFS family permease
MRNALTNLYIEHGVDKELRKSLNYVVLGITFGTIFFNITYGPALTGFAKALGAGEFIYGILMALPVVGGLLQLYASHLLEKTRKRKKMFLVFGVIQRMLWIPVGLVPYVLPVNTGMLRIWSTILFITLASCSGAFINVSFYSWIGDLIPVNIRGRYFSLRSRIATIAGLLSGLIVAKLLDMLPGFPGYTTVFVIAGIVGILDILSFIGVKDIPMKDDESREPTGVVIKKALKDKHFVKYVLFWTAWGFGINFVAAFLNMYALDNLQMSFTEITITGQIVCNITTIFFIAKWGKFVDKYGNKPTLYITCTLTALILLLWLFATPENYIPVLIFNLIGGMIWCGTDITNQNMLITNTPTENRSMYVAIYFAITTIFGNALAYVLGGYFLEHIENITQHFVILGRNFNNYELLIIAGILLRLAAIPLLVGLADERSSSMQKVYKDCYVKLKSWKNA